MHLLEKLLQPIKKQKREEVPSKGAWHKE